MGALLDDKGFDRRPHNIAPDAWYYETPGGLDVIYDGRVACCIPWRSIAASYRRYLKAKEAKCPAK